MKKFIYSIILLAVFAAGFYFLYRLSQKDSFNGIDASEQPRQQGGPVEQAESAERQFQPDFKELTAQILRQGEGLAIAQGDQATVHYVGVLEDGTKFDSSVDRGQPFTFTLGAGQVIQGWDLGVAGMKVGEIRRLYIPFEFGYGEVGAGNGAIPPNANLIFEVELLKIN